MQSYTASELTSSARAVFHSIQVRASNSDISTDAPTTMERRRDHNRSATIADSPPQVLIFEIVNGGLLGIYKPCRCCDARQDVVLQGLCGNRQPATCCKHDGGVHATLMSASLCCGECLIPVGAVVVVTYRSYLVRSVHDQLLCLMRSPVSHRPGC